MQTRSEESEASIHQYLTFQCNGKEYAIEILRMREIILFTRATEVSMAPASIRGLINLRGTAVPVVDLAVRFGASPTTASKRSCVLVVDLGDGQDRPEMGILADSVNKVIDVLGEDVENTPDFGTGIPQGLLSGLARVEGNFVPILDVDHVVKVDQDLGATLHGSLQGPSQEAISDVGDSATDSGEADLHDGSKG